MTRNQGRKRHLWVSVSADLMQAAARPRPHQPSATARVRTSRFQFVDLAGSERLQEAHGATVRWK